MKKGQLEFRRLLDIARLLDIGSLKTYLEYIAQTNEISSECGMEDHILEKI